MVDAVSRSNVGYYILSQLKTLTTQFFFEKCVSKCIDIQQPCLIKTGQHRSQYLSKSIDGIQGPTSYRNV